MLIPILIIITLIPWIYAENKTKRTTHELYTYGQTSPILFYTDNLGSFSSNRSPNLYTGPESVTPLGVPQAIQFYEQPEISRETNPYEQQHIPTNVVPNKQLLHPATNTFDQYTNQPYNHRYQGYTSPISAYPNMVPLQNVLLPHQNRYVEVNRGIPAVHESNIHHDSNTKLYQLYPHYNGQNIVPPRYFPSNGKFVADPHQKPHVNHNIVNHPQFVGDLLPPYPQLPNNYYRFRSKTADHVNRHSVPSNNVFLQRNVPLDGYNKFHVTQKPYHVTVVSPEKKIEINKNSELNSFKTNETYDDNIEKTLSGDNSSEQADESDSDNTSSNYFFKYDNKDGDDESSAEANSDEDSKRDSTKYEFLKDYSKKNKIKNKSRHESANKKIDDSEEILPQSRKRIPKMIYKSLKYSKEVNKPKVDFLEARYSENIPVTHKQKFFRVEYNKIFKT